MIDGMEMDAGEQMRAPPLVALERYCRCVAGAVGLLSVRVFGALGPGPEQGALALGEALQLTNILRDLTEDAARGRLYLPRELLEQQGIVTRDPERVLEDRRCPRSAPRWPNARGGASRTPIAGSPAATAGGCGRRW